MMTLEHVGAFLAGFGFGLLAGGLAVRHGLLTRRKWRDRPRLPTFIIKE